MCSVLPQLAAKHQAQGCIAGSESAHVAEPRLLGLATRTCWTAGVRHAAATLAPMPASMLHVQAWRAIGSPGKDMLAAGVVSFGSYVAYEELHPPVAAKKPEAAPSVGAVGISAASAATH